MIEIHISDASKHNARVNSVSLDFCVVIEASGEPQGQKKRAKASDMSFVEDGSRGEKSQILLWKRGSIGSCRHNISKGRR